MPQIKIKEFLQKINKDGKSYNSQNQLKHRAYYEFYKKENYGHGDNYLYKSCKIHIKLFYHTIESLFNAVYAVWLNY